MWRSPGHFLRTARYHGHYTLWAVSLSSFLPAGVDLGRLGVCVFHFHPIGGQTGSLFSHPRVRRLSSSSSLFAAIVVVVFYAIETRLAP